MGGPRLLPYGRWALLAELESVAAVTATTARLRAAELPDVVELVPAARTVLVAVRPGSSTLDAVRELLDRPVDANDPPEAGPLVTIPVHYGGADLELVARTADLDVDEVVELHTSAEYTVAFCGFAPGFGYLTGLPKPLQQARLDSSRSAVPAGSVGVAGEFSGIYPRGSPGGWRLLGHTELTMFDPAVDPPARLRPGDRVRFERA